MINENKSITQQAREYVSSGQLRYVLEKEHIPDDIIQKIIDACSFVLKC